MRLAIALGKTLEEIRQMSGTELDLWIAYDQQVGFDDPYLRTAIVSTVVANHAGKTRKTPAEVKDFLPQCRRKQQTTSEQRRIFERLIKRPHA